MASVLGTVGSKWSVVKGLSKVLLVFYHMGLQVYSARSFFRHQKFYLFPIILHHWETYQANIVSRIKQLKDVAWTGDGRFDSVGHSAKYGVYTMFCITVMKIVHFELVQVCNYFTNYNNYFTNFQNPFCLSFQTLPPPQRLVQWRVKSQRHGKMKNKGSVGDDV